MGSIQEQYDTIPQEVGNREKGQVEETPNVSPRPKSYEGSVNTVTGVAGGNVKTSNSANVVNGVMQSIHIENMEIKMDATDLFTKAYSRTAPEQNYNAKARLCGEDYDVSEEDCQHKHRNEYSLAKKICDTLIDEKGSFVQPKRSLSCQTESTEACEGDNLGMETQTRQTTSPKLQFDTKLNTSIPKDDDMDLHYPRTMKDFTQCPTCMLPLKTSQTSTAFSTVRNRKASVNLRGDAEHSLVSHTKEINLTEERDIFRGVQAESSAQNSSLEDGLMCLLKTNLEKMKEVAKQDPTKLKEISALLDDMLVPSSKAGNNGNINTRTGICCCMLLGVVVLVVVIIMSLAQNGRPIKQ